MQHKDHGKGFVDEWLHRQDLRGENRSLEAERSDNNPVDCEDAGPNRECLQSQVASLNAEFSNGHCSSVDYNKQSDDRPDAGPRRSHFDTEHLSLQAKWYDDLYVMFCTTVYLADVVTDTLVCVKYFNSGDYIWFSFTLFFTLIAHIVMAIFSIIWYYHDLAKEASKTRIVLLHIFNLGPLLRYWEVYKSGKNTRNKPESRSTYNCILVEQWRDITMLRLFEAFIESAPQMVLQLYILAYNRSFDEERDWLTAVSACCSLLSLSSSIVSYSKALRDARVDRGNMSYWAFACQLVWRLTMVASRIIALVLFASVYKSWIFLVMGFHWIISIIWVSRQGSSFFEKPKNPRVDQQNDSVSDQTETAKIRKAMFSIVVGFIYVFCFFNTKDGKTRKRLVVFYIVMFLEDCILMGLWLPYRHEYGVVFVIAVSWVFGGFAIGVIAMILYYQFYHPSSPVQGVCFRTDHDIPTTQGVVVEYLCCNYCCIVRHFDDEGLLNRSSPRHIVVDIPASRGSVGRSVVRQSRESSPPFESEWLNHEPSKTQRKRSLDKHKRKQLQAERTEKFYQEARDKKEAREKQEVPLDGAHLRNIQNNESFTANGRQQGNIVAMGCLQGDKGREGGVMGGSCSRAGMVGCGATGMGGGRVSERAMHDGDDETITSVVFNGTCDDGVHCGTDDENETGTSLRKVTTCDDGLHCGTDDEQETGTKLVKSRTCDDGVHCGTDDENETGTSLRKVTSCDDGLHCGTDDEQETGAELAKRKTCDDGLHCGTDDEQETGTKLVKSRTCDDGLHCGTDDEQDTAGTKLAKTKTCDDGLHCGTDDEQETEAKLIEHKTCKDYTSGVKLPETKSEVKSNLIKLAPYKRPLTSLTFNNRYSIVSDCISLSSSSSNETQEGAAEEQNTALVCRNNNETALDKNNNPKTSPRRRKQNRVSFPNFVASNLARGKYASLRVSRERIIEERPAMQRRHTVDFSQLGKNSGGNTFGNYVTFINNLRPKRFGSVRADLAKCGTE